MTDDEAVAKIFSRISRLSTVLAKRGSKSISASKAFRRLNREVRGESFSAEFCVLPDHASDSCCECIQIKLTSLTEKIDRLRFLYVRIGGAGRRLKDPQIWRRKLGGLRRASGVVSSSRDIWWDQRAPADTIKAQVIIAIFQLGLLPQNSKHWTEIYKLVQKIPASVGRGIEKRDAVQTTVIRLMKCWSFPEDWRAFQAYVRITIRYACQNPDYSPRVRPDQETFTVKEAGAFLKLSVWYLYDLLSKGLLREIPNSKPRRVHQDELEKIQRILNRRLELQERRRDLEANWGKSAPAARKAIYRKYGRRPKISDLNPVIRGSTD
jgi:hypothetical protein